MHGGNARAYRDVDAAPGRFPFVDRLKNRRRHREHARIAAGDDRDMMTLLGQAQSMPRAPQFVAVAGLVATLPLFERKPFEVGRVADKIGRVADQARSFGRDPCVVAWANADDPQASRGVHGRLPWPGMRIEEKYGAWSSIFAASG